MFSCFNQQFHISFRTLILCHKHELLEQLSNCQDPALTLHLAVLVIFTIATQNMLHASGKYVSSILSFLQPYLSSEQSQALKEYHDLVLKLLTSSPDSEQYKEVSDRLNETLASIKEIASSYKKSGGSNAE